MVQMFAMITRRTSTGFSRSGMAAEHQSPYAYDRLAPAVKSSATSTEVVEKLGLAVTPHRRRAVIEQARRLGIDTSHFENRAKLYSDEQIAEAVAASTSFTEAARRL